MECKSKKSNLIVTILIFVVVLALGVICAIDYISFRNYEAYFDSSNCTQVQTLGDYNENLPTYGAETKVYVLAGDEAQAKYDERVRNGEKGTYEGCASVLILGGTHANEPSGQLTATLLLENLEVSGNTVVFIITETNRSAYSYSFPQDGSPEYYTLTTKSGGTRTFKFGTRATNPVDQWPNPDIYVVTRNLPDGESIESKLSSTDSRNLNRAYGIEDPVTYTEQVTKAITNLITENDIKVVFDLHEASPEYITINAIVYNNRNNETSLSLTADIATKTRENMETYYGDSIDETQGEGISIGSNQAPDSLRGLSHIELGTYTDALVFLCETSNASQGKLRGAFTTDLITYGSDTEEYDVTDLMEGVDIYYDNFSNIKDGKTEGTNVLAASCAPIRERVARHVMTILEILSQYNRSLGDGATAEQLLTEERASRLNEAGKIEISLDLYSENEDDFDDDYSLERYADYIGCSVSTQKYSLQACQAYEVLLIKGVGYFLKDEVK